ncbi:carboxypeptidase-like regulatory domain-containing protein [Pedobacter sp. V48]|uniref:carboxypeptidase-like regulatory domain-containing protein n=1 Tax=Pedobacter sp. V48 TaxID=509635 RepID=UPI0003E54513|nr:carboxypeptidase-like regulatory domain-containing protein [Pedobacter sp. V48]ETZ20313.1 hypothetical protein N824_08855 [Pedobacter sp. V48]
MPELFAQVYSGIKLHGIVADSTNKQPLPNASIYNDQNHNATVSNDEGAFEIHTDVLPVTLSISYVGYQTKKITVTDTTQHLSIVLSPASISLDPVVVDGDGAIQLIRKAFEKTYPHATRKYYGKGYIRQFTKEGNTYTGMQEAIFNGQWQSFAMTGWQPLQTRYANLEKSMISFTNFSFFSFMSTGYLPSNIVRKPITKKPDSLYDCRIIQYITGINMHEIAVIMCTPKSNKTHDMFAGKIFIDTENYDVLKLEGKILNFSFDLSGPLKLKDTEVNTIVNFKKTVDGAIVLDFADIKFTSKATFGFVTAKKLFYDAKILMYDYDDALSKEKYMIITPKIHDVGLMKNIPYSSDTWDRNTRISHTPLENEIIRSFERRKLISNYLR